MEGLRTALIVVVPEAESVVSPLRSRLDPVARLGVPAHVSILYPFMSAVEINDEVVHRIAELFEVVPAFGHHLDRTAWFGDDVLWLATDAADTFRSLTDLVHTEFPTYPPYEGRFDAVVPHLTIADRGPVGAMREAERAVQNHLPISAVVRAITLLVEQPRGDWRPARTFTLNGPTRSR